MPDDTTNAPDEKPPVDNHERIAKAFERLKLDPENADPVAFLEHCAEKYENAANDAEKANWQQAAAYLIMRL